MYPKSTPLPDEEPPTPLTSYTDNEDGGDTVPDHGLVGEYSANIMRQESNGAAYGLQHLRSAPPQEFGPSSGQGRLRMPAVPYSDERVGQVSQTFTQTPNGESLQYANMMPEGPTSNAAAMAHRVPEPHHTLPFNRGRDGTARLTGNNFYAEQQGATNANGRQIHGSAAVQRTDQRYR